MDQALHPLPQSAPPQHHEHPGDHGLSHLYRNVLYIELYGHIDALRARKDKRLPVVLTKAEVQQVFDRMSGLHLLMAQLLYGTGMRLMECMRLRVKDVVFSHHQIIVRDTKGNEDRVTMLPERLVPSLQQQLAAAKQLHTEDLAKTMVYTHVLNKGPLGVRSPLD